MQAGLRRLLTTNAIRPDAAVALAIVLVWVILAVIVNPIGDFPLNDDWSYGRTVKILLDEHRFHLIDLNTATFAFQALYGVLFCIPFDFSFTALRISTLVLGVAGVIWFYYLLRQVTPRKTLAACGSFVLMLNPIFYLNAFSFMTDVPFTSLEILSALFLVKALRSDSRRDERIGFALLCCATLIRQIALPIAFAYGLTLFFTSGQSGWRRLRGFWLTLGLAGLLALYSAVFYLLDTPLTLGSHKQEEIAYLLAKLGQGGYSGLVIRNIYTFFIYMCVLTLPLAILLLGHLLRRTQIKTNATLWQLLATAILLFSGCLFIYALNAQYFHIVGNSINPWFTLGPCDLPNSCNFLSDVLPQDLGMAELATAAIVVDLCLVATLVAQFRRQAASSRGFRVALFAALACAGLVAPFMFGKVYDRYFLPPLPFALLLLVSVTDWALANGVTPHRLRTAWLTIPVIGVMLLASGIFAVSGTHDYLEWNRARWQAISDLTVHSGIDPAMLDGGFEVSGWYLFDTDEALRQRWRGWYAFDNPYRRIDAKYVIGFSAAGRPWRDCKKTQIAGYPFSFWLMDRKLEIAVIKNFSDADQPEDCKK
jgi:hypothetical protein